VGFADVAFANAELVAVPVTHAIPLPGEISFETAASVLLQGLSAHFLATDCHKTRAGETVVIHAAAGGQASYSYRFVKYPELLLLRWYLLRVKRKSLLHSALIPCFYTMRIGKKKSWQ